MKSKDVCDENLLDELHSGDNAAMTELVRRYLPLICHKAAGYRLPGMEHEDLVQEGLLGLLKAIRLYLPEKSSFATFASICVTSSMAEAAKRALSGKSLPLSNYLPLAEEEEALLWENSPEQQLALREEATELLKRIATHLSTFEQQVLRLYLTGHSYQEISLSLSTSPKAVDNALQRVRRKLRTA